MFQYFIILICSNFFEVSEKIIVKALPSSETHEYVIPNDITSTRDGNENDYVFQDLKDQEFTVVFTIGNNIERIGNFTFYSCTKLMGVNFSLCEKLTTIGSHAFTRCTSLSTLILPPNLTTIYNSFQYTAIQSIHFPKSFIEVLQFYPFYKCYNLIQATFDDNANIDTLAYGFLAFTSVKSFRIPKNLRGINGQTFQMTPIEEFTIEDGNKYFKTYNKSLYSINYTTLFVYIKSTTEYSFPKELEKIHVLPFSKNYGELIIPEHVIQFRNNAFHEFLGTKIIIQSHSFQLTESMFYDAINLKEFYIPEGVESIPSNCFRNCTKLYSLYIPFSLRSIEDDAFTSTKIKCFLGNYANFKTRLFEIGQYSSECLILDKVKTCKQSTFHSHIGFLYCILNLIC